MTALEEVKKAEHERIWLEPAGAPDRCWCQDNQWGDEGVEYVLASTLESLQREKEAMRQRLDAGPHGEDAIDVAESAADFLRHRAEAAEAEVARLQAILEPFRTVSKDWVDENGWTDVACQKDRIVDWFGPSDFRALASTGGEHHADK